MIRRPALLARLWGDREGAAVVEFALVAPTLLIVVMGIFDLGYNIYANTMLQGAIQKAARSSTIEGSSSRTSQIDAKVADAVRVIVPQAQIKYSRRAYASFTDISKAEDFTDSDSDGICNNGEPFEDANRNGSWDDDRGLDGQGGARDAVLYTVRVSYPRLLPMAELIGLPGNVDTEATTVLRNQPYNVQNNEPIVGACT